MSEQEHCLCPTEDAFSGLKPGFDGSCPEHGFYAKDGSWRHPNDLSRVALRELVGDMSWMLLDLAQHLNFMNLQFEPGGRKGPLDEDAPGYKEAERMAYSIGSFPYEGPGCLADHRRTPGVAIFDGNGGFSV